MIFTGFFVPFYEEPCSSTKKIFLSSTKSYHISYICKLTQNKTAFKYAFRFYEKKSGFTIIIYYKATALWDLYYSCEFPGT